MGKTLKNIEEFGMMAFVLLGVIFGMMIMTLIFGNLGSSIDTSFDSTNTLVNNESGFLNVTTNETFNVVSNQSFDGNIAIVEILNTSSTTDIGPGNFTLFPNFGLIQAVPGADENYTDVLYTYTFDVKPEAQLVSENTNNNSLTAINTYSTQADTQFTTIAIAITLAILIAVFVLFAASFMRGKGGRGKQSMSSYGSRNTPESGMDV